MHGQTYHAFYKRSSVYITHSRTIQEEWKRRVAVLQLAVSLGTVVLRVASVRPSRASINSFTLGWGTAMQEAFWA